MLTLLLHLMLVGAGPAVDVRVELETLDSGHAAVHVEDAQDPHCSRGHAHPVCLIRALQSLDASPRDAALAAALHIFSLRPPLAPVLAPPAATAVSALGPRAPPPAAV